MTGRFPFVKVAKYPHMKPEDIAVWERLLMKYPGFFDTVDYDLPVGKGATPDPAAPENMQRDHVILTQKKIDAVGYKDDIISIVEIGPIADMRKLGQILTYVKLYLEDHPDVSRVNGMVVAGAVERELEALFSEHGITLVVV